MKIGIVTLVSDNYGNKFQNFAVEYLLSKYGEVTTFAVESKRVEGKHQSRLSKMSPGYIRKVIKSRLMYKYDMTDNSHGVLLQLLYFVMHKRQLTEIKAKRHDNFRKFSDRYLHICTEPISASNQAQLGIMDYDLFVCGSDQIWNPSYGTTTDLAFLPFAKAQKAIALAPSFGVDSIPRNQQSMFSDAIRKLDFLSIREMTGKTIIKELTGRDATLLADPTLAIGREVWASVACKPRGKLPPKYVLCYFLGRVSKARKQEIEEYCRENHYEAVRLFDIQSSDYYQFGPAEVLYAIEHADVVLTDSFHGLVFSFIFHRNFKAFEREESGPSMMTRIDSLFEIFRINRTTSVTQFNASEWKTIDSIMLEEANKVRAFLEGAIASGHQ